MSDSKSRHGHHEGSVSKSYSDLISEERIREFCRAVGAETGIAAPPTFLTVFRAGEFELLEKMGIPLASVLHGEQVYTYESELHSGDEATFKTTLSSVHEKKGGAGRMTFLSLETVIEVTQKNPRRVGISKTTIIVREKSEKGAA